MAKLLVFSIGILWACLLFISWGQADDFAARVADAPGVSEHRP